MFFTAQIWAGSPWLCWSHLDHLCPELQHSQDVPCAGNAEQPSALLPPVIFPAWSFLSLQISPIVYPPPVPQCCRSGRICEALIIITIIILTKQQLCLWFLLPCPLWDCWGVKSLSAERELKRLAGWCPSPLWWFLACASSPLKLPGLSALKTSIKYILQPWEESPTSQRAMDLKINADFPCRVAWGKVQARNSIHWGNQQEKKLNQ